MINNDDRNTSLKVNWQGEIVSVQPRTRVWRYLTDNRTHYHIGYNLFIVGNSGDGKNEFSVAISEIQYSKGLYGIGDVLKGTAWHKKYEKRESADYYRAGSLKILSRADVQEDVTSPPWTNQAPPIAVYENRGARLLSKSIWTSKCFKCMWANMANVEIQWDFDKNIKKYRFETFCYGPMTCKLYKKGRGRSVPYKNRGSAIDDGYLDELCTEYREEEG